VRFDLPNLPKRMTAIMLATLCVRYAYINSFMLSKIITLHAGMEQTGSQVADVLMQMQSAQKRQEQRQEQLAAWKQQAVELQARVRLCEAEILSGKGDVEDKTAEACRWRKQLEAVNRQIAQVRHGTLKG